jgi:hypothetical protein
MLRKTQLIIATVTVFHNNIPICIVIITAHLQICEYKSSAFSGIQHHCSTTTTPAIKRHRLQTTSNDSDYQTTMNPQQPPPVKHAGYVHALTLDGNDEINPFFNNHYDFARHWHRNNRYGTTQYFRLFIFF